MHSFTELSYIVNNQFTINVLHKTPVKRVLKSNIPVVMRECIFPFPTSSSDLLCYCRMFFLHARSCINKPPLRGTVAIPLLCLSLMRKTLPTLPLLSGGLFILCFSLMFDLFFSEQSPLRSNSLVILSIVSC